MNGWRILVVDDDPVFAETLAQALRRRGHQTSVAHDGETALVLAADSDFAAAVLDLRLAADSGLRLIAPLKAAHPDLRILLLTGYASIATAVEAIKLGAVHYLAKPAGVDEILAALGREGGDAAVAPAEEPMSVDRLEWEHIQKVLAENDGNLSATARALKMHRRTLQRKLAKRPVRE
ncbi:MAG: response regulator transcription factor [Gammaproteobacteria bacterium]|nr:response regulator transcription factor [Gammaproteobacteria bacterium]